MDAQKAHGGLACEEIRHLLVVSRHIGGGYHAFLDRHRPDGAQSRDVSGAEHVRVGGPAVFIVDKTEPGQFQAGILEEFDVGTDAGGDNEEIAGKHCPVAERDLIDLTVLADTDFIDSHAVVLFDALCPEGVDIGPGRPLVQLFVEEPAGKVYEGHLDTHVKEAGRAVNADEAGSQHHDVLSLLRDLLQDFNVVDIAEADIVLSFRQALYGRDKGM